MPDEDTTITEEQSDAGAAVPDPEAAPVVSAEPPVSATPAPAEPAGSVAADDEVTAEETTVEPAIEGSHAILLEQLHVKSPPQEGSRSDGRPVDAQIGREADWVGFWRDACF